jgi:hypothetical protein
MVERRRPREQEESDPAVVRALEKRKRLQETIRTSMEEVRRIDEWLRMRSELIAEDEVGDAALPKEHEPEKRPKTSLSAAGWGQAQQAFEVEVKAILREHGLPMQSQEIVEELINRGINIGTNPIKTGWNRLWQAKSGGTLIHIPDYGYWLANEPVPSGIPIDGKTVDGSEPIPPPKRQWRNPRVQKNAGRPRGRQKELTTAQEAFAAKLMLESDMTMLEIAKAVGVSGNTLYRYFPGGRRAVKKAHSEQLYGVQSDLMDKEDKT